MFPSVESLIKSLIPSNSQFYAQFQFNKLHNFFNYYSNKLLRMFRVIQIFNKLIRDTYQHDVDVLIVYLKCKTNLKDMILIEKYLILRTRSRLMSIIKQNLIFLRCLRCFSLFILLLYSVVLLIVVTSFFKIH